MQSVARVRGPRRRRLPHGHAHGPQSLLARHVIDQSRDPFHGRIAVNDEDWFAEGLQRFHERIIVSQDHLVIELAVNPPLDDPLDVAEIHHHIPCVQRIGAHLDLGDRVVAVRMLADAVVVEQPMAVAEVDALGDGVYDK